MQRLTHANYHYPIWERALWTAKQRQMHPIHYVVSYRASFKPELPDFFIRHYLDGQRGEEAVILDPFGGRGTTALQANMLGFRAIHNDLNPLSLFLARARQKPPSYEKLCKRLMSLSLDRKRRASSFEKERLLPFFHPRTLNEILNLRDLIVHASLEKDRELAYIALTALSRLHGHSEGFLSVYSFPQISVLPLAQARNNQRLGNKAEYRCVKEKILRKMKRDLAQPLPNAYTKAAAKNLYLCLDASCLRPIAKNSVDLIVTSPPFLDKVNYPLDNWMRAWFLGLEEELKLAPLMITSDMAKWLSFMKEVMREMGRVLRLGAHAVIEVGEVSIGRNHYKLEENLAACLPMKVDGGRLLVKEIFINQQSFSKLSNCWSVANNRKGTNTNRCLVLQKSFTALRSGLKNTSMYF